MYKNDRADAGMAPRDVAHETDRSAETVARELLPPQLADPFQETERDGSPPRLPAGLPSTQEDGTLLYEPGASQHDDLHNPESGGLGGPVARRPRVRGSRRAGPGRDGMGVVYRARQTDRQKDMQRKDGPRDWPLAPTQPSTAPGFLL